MESFGFDDKYIHEHLNSTKSLMRMMKYKGVEDTKEEESGMEAHTDRNMLTIIFQNSVADGIEVKTKDDKHWIKANASQDSSFIVLAGSMLHVSLPQAINIASIVSITQHQNVLNVFSGTVERSGVIFRSPCDEARKKHKVLGWTFLCSENRGIDICIRKGG